MRSLAVIVALAVASTASASYLRMAEPLGDDLNTNVTDVCWKGTYGRGVGTVIDTCHPPLVKSGWLCYPECKTDYVGVGPVCWQRCPEGWINEGALCREKGSIRTIAKDSYGRGAGVPLQCPLDKQYDAGLCYTPCKETFLGVGPVCWEQCDSVPLHNTNGGAICCTSAETCTKKIRDLCAGVPLAIAKALLSGGNATIIEHAVVDAIDSVLGYVMPLCTAL